MKLSIVPGDVFNDLNFVEGMRLAHKMGIDAVELHCWWEEKLDEILHIKNEMQMDIVTICAPFTQLTDPNTVKEYLTGMKETVEVARSLSCEIVIVTTGDKIPDVERETQHTNIVSCLKQCVPIAEQAGITLAIEPLNTMVGVEGCDPNYYLWSSDEAFQICEEVGGDHIKVLYDIYHQQVMEGNILHRVTKNAGKIAHFHAAGVPGRCEIDSGELSYLGILAGIKATGYRGYVGLEYTPERDPRDGLTIAKSYMNEIEG